MVSKFSIQYTLVFAWHEAENDCVDFFPLLYSVLFWPVNPLIPVASSELLEMIDRSTYILACLIKPALDSDINWTVSARVVI